MARRRNSTRFTAETTAFVNKTIAKIDAVWKASAQDAVGLLKTSRDEGGRMPVVTNFLRSSLRVSTSEVPPIDRDARPEEGVTYNFNDNEVQLVINNAELGGHIYFGYVASYAAIVEYVQGAGFIQEVVDTWSINVAKNSRELERRTVLNRQMSRRR